MLSRGALAVFRRVNGMGVGIRGFVMDPEGEAAFVWSALLSTLVMYNFWSVILRISFSEMRHSEVSVGVFLVLDGVADTVYIIDLLFQFRMCYLEDGIQVTDTCKLAAHYRKGRRMEFLVDVFSAAPLTNFYALVVGFISRVCPRVHIYKDTIFPILRLPKLAKLPSLAFFLTTWDMKTNTPNLLRACRLLLFLATNIHWIGCFYHMISEMEGLGCNNWVLGTLPPDSGSQFWSKYLRSVYWSGMTLTTIGNDGHPHTDIEYMFTGCTFLIGVFMFATVVGNVGDVISSMNAARVAFQQKMDGIKMYMRYHNVPPSVQTKVKKWAEYSWNRLYAGCQTDTVRTRAMDDMSTLDILPFRLRTEIAKHVHLETLQKVKIFEGCEQGLLCELVVKLRSQIYSPCDYICRKGEIGREMYIINHGKVEVQIPSPADPETTLVVATLLEGNFFGEISLLKLEEGCNRRTADVQSVGYSELLILSKRDLHQALVEYPEARRALETQARFRIQKIQAESSLTVRSNPELVPVSRRGVPNESSEARPDTEEKAVRERELSELAHLIKDLRCFDSQAMKKELEEVKKQCYSLQCELKQKNHEMESVLEGCPDCLAATTNLRWNLIDQQQSGTGPNTSRVTTDNCYSQEDEWDPPEVNSQCGCRNGSSSSYSRVECGGRRAPGRRRMPHLQHPGEVSSGPPIYTKGTIGYKCMNSNCGSSIGKDITGNGTNGNCSNANGTHGNQCSHSCNRVPTVINGCLRLYDNDLDSSSSLSDITNLVTEETISVIVPQISVNGELLQELKAMQMDTPEWLQGQTECQGNPPGSQTSVPPLVFIEEYADSDKGASTGVGEPGKEDGGDLGHCDVGTVTSDAVMTLQTSDFPSKHRLSVVDSLCDSYSDVSDMESDTD